MLSVEAAAAAVAAAQATASRVPGQKKSCDLCVFRKRRCDGAMPTCGFCASRGCECHYSLRRPNRPRGYAKGLAGRPGYGSGTEDTYEMQQRQQDSPIGWKRIRLSASPATGLVGTKENSFLGSFFSCLGFLPMTHERLIRETMMEILLASSPGSGIGGQASAGGPNTSSAESLTGAWEQEGGDPASACALWCSIAMGALVQGQPPKQVAPYMQLAWTSLSQCFDAVTVESGRAFLMMAYLHNFMRDDDKFCRYLQFARSVADRLPENTEQKQEIDDLVMMGEDTRIFHTAALEPSELDAYCTDESPALEVPDVVHKGDLCRLLLQADRRMMKAFLRDHRAQAAVPAEHRKPHACCGSESVTPERCSGGERDGRCTGGEEGYLTGMSIKMGGISIDSTRIDEETRPSRPGDETWKCTEETQKIFARLGTAAEAPEIQAGVGGLLYNSILGYLDMVTGSAELEAGFEKVKHCAEILSRYPGLCRFSTWRHLSHCLLSFLSKLGDVELFEELRQAYNSVRAEDTPAVPPHAEWTMVGFCDHIFCRSMDHLEKHWGGPNATVARTAGDLEERRWLSNEPHWLHDTDANNNHWASLAPKIHCTTAIPDQTFPTHEWTDVMPPGLVNSSSSAAQQWQHMAPAPGVPGAGPNPMAYVNPAWAAAGHTPATADGGRANDGASAYMGARAADHSRNGWNAPGHPAATHVPYASQFAGVGWPHPSHLAAASSIPKTFPSASRAYQGFGENAVHDRPTAVGDEWGVGGTSGSSTSDMSGAESGNDGAAERTTGGSMRLRRTLRR